MNSRRLNWLVLGFTCLWFGMFVPVHQRGLMQLPGGVAAAHCSTEKPSHCQKKTAGKKPVEKQSPKTANCAVCHFIAGLHVPPPVTVVESRLGLLDLRPLVKPATPVISRQVLPIHGRAPPIV
ncbi:MAG: DUF2946 family protein [Burkholderiales bacterium]|nr:DUF2946 family protein [Phycisphaerae bacterium]